MYPDVSYLLSGVFGIQPDGSLSIIKTYGLLQFTSFVTFFLLSYKRIQSKPIFIKLMATNYNKTVCWLALVSLVAIAVYFVQSRQNLPLFISIILVLFLPWQLRISYVKNTRINYFFFLVMLLMVALLGSKVQLLIEHYHKIDHILEFLLWGSGHSLFGGLAAILLLFVWYYRRKDIEERNALVHVLSAICFAICAAIAIGKMGCHLAGDGCWGREVPIDFWLPSIVSNYPHNVINEGVPIPGCTFKYCNVLTNAVYALPLIESMLMVCISLFFVKKRKHNIGIFLVAIGLLRLMTGFLNDNVITFTILGGLSASQSIASLLIVFGISIIFYTYEK